MRHYLFFYWMIFSIGLLQPNVSFAGERIVVLETNGSVAPYDIPAKVFAADLTKAGYTVEVFDLRGKLKRGRQMVAQMKTTPPALIFVTGNKAAVVAAEAFSDVPVIFAMVLNWRGLQLQKKKNFVGISLEVPPLSQFTQLKLVAPEVSRIGVMYSVETPPEVIDQAKSDANKLGMAIVAKELQLTKGAESIWKALKDVSPIKSISALWRSLRESISIKQVNLLWGSFENEIDALWMVPDPIVYDQENFRYLARKSEKGKKLFLAYSQNFVKGGALLSISPDYEGIGHQAVNLAERILGGESYQGMGIVAPINTTLVLNKKTAQQIGLNIERVFEFVDILVE